MFGPIDVSIDYGQNFPYKYEIPLRGFSGCVAINSWGLNMTIAFPDNKFSLESNFIKLITLSLSVINFGYIYKVTFQRAFLSGEKIPWSVRKKK
jgi:hypothetical protein